MKTANIVTPDTRGRVVLPGRYKQERILEFQDCGDHLVLYPVTTVRKFPVMDDVPEVELSPVWLAEECAASRQDALPVIAGSPREALRKTRRRK